MIEPPFSQLWAHAKHLMHKRGRKRGRKRHVRLDAAVTSPTAVRQDHCSLCSMGEPQVGPHAIYAGKGQNHGLGAAWVCVSTTGGMPRHHNHQARPLLLQLADAEQGLMCSCISHVFQSSALHAIEPGRMAWKVADMAHMAWLQVRLSTGLLGQLRPVPMFSRWPKQIIRRWAPYACSHPNSHRLKGTATA